MKNYLSFKRGLLTAFIVLISLATSLAVEVTVNFTTSTGDPIEGSTISYRTDGNPWSIMGFTDINGEVISELGTIIGNASFKVEYAGAIKTTSQNVNTNSVVNFSTVLVNMKLLASNESELAGTNARYKYGSSWFQFGSGTTTTSMELLPTTYQFRVVYGNNFNSKTQNVGGDSDVIFQIATATLVFVDSEEDEIESTDAKYLNNGVWLQFGDGTSNETIELLNGTYRFRVYYNGAFIEKEQYIGDNSEVVFNTVNVELQFSGNIDYAFGGLYLPFASPMELLPLEYDFRFSGAGYDPEIRKINIPNENIVKTVTYLKLKDSNGNNLEGGISSYKINNVWYAGEITNSLGIALNIIDGQLNSGHFKMVYNETISEKNQNLNNSFVDFQTMLVSMKLLNENEDEIASSNAEYNVQGIGWFQFGDGITTESIEMFDGVYVFRVHLNGPFEDKSQNVAANNEVVFNTTAVTMTLLNSNDEEIEGTDAEYWYGGFWYTFGDGLTSETIEMLPVTYDFRVEYAGRKKQVNQNTNVNTQVTFNTIAVTVSLVDSEDNLLEGTNVRFFSNSWYQFGTGITDVTSELFAGQYDFRVTYDGDVMQKTQNVSNDPLVIFIYEVAPIINLLSATDNSLIESGLSTDMSENGSNDLNGANTINNVTAQFKSEGNYPNPFNNSTTIEYTVSVKSDILLSVFDLSGKMIKTLVNENVYPGIYQVKFDGTDQNGNLIPAGMYIYKLIGTDFQETKRMIIQR